VGDDLRERATGAALSVRRVREVHNVRTIDLGGRRELSLHAKLPAETPLAEAHDVADEVEAAIRREAPEIDRVHVHLEPLAQATPARKPAPAEDEEHRRAIEATVRRVSGAPPAEVALHREPRGLVAFVTAVLPPDGTLAEAHDVAGRIEAQVRDEHPDVAEVVVHTEPRAPLSAG
jgi:divalent metal cation (Fe/Co/Zn/Cd) transporter